MALDLSDWCRGRWAALRKKVSSYNTDSPAADNPAADNPAADNPAFDLSWINLDDIRLWMDTCDAEHGNICGATDTRTVVAWLIDVNKQCLVPCDPNIKYQYVALSYVWGQCLSSQTSMANINTFQIPGAFSEENRDVIIPKTIRHAIKLVSLLNIPYLWVDRFCICQDDAKSMHLQLRQMGHIYERAYVTLIAANGQDADHGLHGIKGVTNQRKFSKYEDFKQSYWNNWRAEQSIWYTRGWTFQELFFSRRKLKFQYQTAVWECNCAVWHESTGVSGEIPPAPRVYHSYTRWEANGKSKKSNRVTPWELRTHERHRMSSSAAYPMYTYLQMVREYNGRNLTHPEDRMRAFAGVTTQMEADFPGGFIWGLPVANFEAALLWRNDGIMVRRSDERQDSARFPSWSWAGWEGPIAASHWKNRGVHIVGNTEPKCRNGLIGFDELQLLIIPSCEWHYVTSDDILPVVSNFRLECQEGLGQAREKLQNTLEQNATSVFLKTRTKVVRCIFSAYIGPRSRILAIINLAPSDGRDSSPDTYSPDSSSDRSDDLEVGIGYIYLPRGRKEDVKGRECELMLLSKSEIQQLPQSLFAVFQHLRPKPQAVIGHAWDRLGTESVYDVLWITRRDGIAYREALGVVSVEAFDSLPGEMMDIVLG